MASKTKKIKVPFAGGSYMSRREAYLCFLTRLAFLDPKCASGSYVEKKKNLRDLCYNIGQGFIDRGNYRGSLFMVFMELCEILDEIDYIVSMDYAYDFGKQQWQDGIDVEEGLAALTQFVNDKIEASGLLHKRDELVAYLFETAVDDDEHAQLTNYYDMREELKKYEKYLSTYYYLGYTYTPRKKPKEESPAS